MGAASWLVETYLFEVEKRLSLEEFHLVGASHGVLLVFLSACTGTVEELGAPQPGLDGGTPSTQDAGPDGQDAGPRDQDAGPGGQDAGPGGQDAGPGGQDSGPGGQDAGAFDAGAFDAGSFDGGIAPGASFTFTGDLGSWQGTRRDSTGALIAADVDGDGAMDLIFAQRDRIVAHRTDGSKIWIIQNPDHQLEEQTERNGLPGSHGPGIQAGDVDRDGVTEVLYVSGNNQLVVVDGRSGSTESTIPLPSINSHFDRWEHVIVANFRGQGDVDVLLQASSNTIINSGTYLRDNHIAAFAFEELRSRGASARSLWARDDFVSLSHSVGMVTDLNLDGRDEVIGAMVISPTGDITVNTGIRNTAFPHIDGIAIDDIDPDRPGLEAVLVEESGAKRVICFNASEVLWTVRRDGYTDGDKVQVGEFVPGVRGLEIFLRGANSDDMWVMDRAGNVLADYDFDTQVSPAAWSDSGLEVIFAIHWDGERQHLAAKERHDHDDVGVIDPMTAEVIRLFDETADRIYVADLYGDWREELVVVSGSRVRIHSNTARNPNPSRERLWNNPHYRRKRMTWNYYTP